MFCTSGLIFGGNEGVESRFYALRSRNRFRRYRGRRVLFSCFALSDSFSAVTGASGPVFIFCANGIIFSGTEVVGSLFMFYAPGLIFGGTEGLGSRFHVLRSRTLYRQYRGHRGPFSCFARPDMFSAVPTASNPIFIFSAPGHVFRGTEGEGSLFHVLRSRTHFRRYQGRRCVGSRFHVLCSQTNFRR
jgi:hypothetical protein